MKKEYIAEFRRFGYKPEKWWNAGLYVDWGKRVFDNVEDCRRALEEVKAQYPDRPHTEVSRAGAFGVSCHFDAKEAHDFAIAETRIRVREVTEWEVIK